MVPHGTEAHLLTAFVRSMVPRETEAHEDIPHAVLTTDAAQREGREIENSTLEEGAQADGDKW